MSHTMTERQSSARPYHSDIRYGLPLQHNSVKCSDVTGNRFEWELGEKNKLYQTPSLLAGSLTTMEVKVIEFHRIGVEKVIVPVIEYSTRDLEPMLV